jgi:hypothetical protein
MFKFIVNPYWIVFIYYFHSRNKCRFKNLFSTIRATCPANLTVPNLIILIILREKYILRSSPLCSILHPPVISSLFRRNILLSTLFSNNLSQDSPFNFKKTGFTPVAAIRPHRRIPPPTVHGATGLINIWQHWDTPPDNPGLPRHQSKDSVTTPSGTKPVLP